APCNGELRLRRFSPALTLCDLRRRQLASQRLAISDREDVSVLSRRQGVPSVGFDRVPLNTQAFFIYDAEPVLRQRVVLRRRFAEPPERLRVILRHALAGRIQSAQGILRARQALFRGLAIPHGRSR